MYSHQDWEPLVLNKKSNIEKKKSYVSCNTEESNVKLPNKFNKDFIKEVINQRCLNKMNRSDLAKKLGVSINDIDRFETEKMPYNGTFVSKLKKIFKLENNPKVVVGNLFE